MLPTQQRCVYRGTEPVALPPGSYHRLAESVRSVGSMKRRSIDQRIFGMTREQEGGLETFEVCRKF